MTLKSDDNTIRGFVTTVLSHSESEFRQGNAGCRDIDVAKNARLLIISTSDSSRISNKTQKTPIKKKSASKTANRKQISYAGTITHNGATYPINNGSNYGIYKPILERTIDQLDACQKKWNRVLIIRFDLHQKCATDTSKWVSRFRKNLSIRLQRKYEMREFGYCWVRETERAKSQHYHATIFVDGNKIRHPSALTTEIRSTWENIAVGNTVWFPRNCFYNVTDSETKAAAIYRLSYMGKCRGKGHRPPQSKDFATSRLTNHPT